jgi:polyhydroxyalkanoate synthesis regulator phasin
MLDLIKKTVLTGVGLAGLTRDKVEKLARALAKQGNLSEKEGQKLIEDLSKRADKAKKDFEAQIARLVKRTVRGINLATKEDMAKLTERIKKLEQALKTKGS